MLCVFLKRQRNQIERTGQCNMRTDAVCGSVRGAVRCSFFQEVADFNLREIVSTSAPSWYSPSASNMWQPYCDIYIGRVADTKGNLKLQEFSWLTQLAEPRKVLLRRLGENTRYIVLGHSCGIMGWMWRVVESENKPGLYSIDLSEGRKMEPFTILDHNDWVGQSIRVVTYTPPLSLFVHSQRSV